MTTSIKRVVSQDTLIRKVLSELPDEPAIKINLSGITGVLMDERLYEGLIETIRIIQENPAIVQSLNERENGDFVDEEEILQYV